MPTLALKVQQDGTWRGWSLLEGALSGYQAVDDSDGTSHDSAATYLRLPKLQLTQGEGRVSFPVFLQAEGLIPVSLTVNVVARAAGGGGGATPNMQIGILSGGVAAFHASLFDPVAGWALVQRTFSVNPATGAPWSAQDLVGLEVCVQNVNLENGSNDLTLVSGSMEYVPVTNALRSSLWAQPIS